MLSIFRSSPQGARRRVHLLRCSSSNVSRVGTVLLGSHWVSLRHKSSCATPPTTAPVAQVPESTPPSSTDSSVPSPPPSTAQRQVTPGLTSSTLFKRQYYYYWNEKGHLYHIYDVDRFLEDPSGHLPSGPTYLRDGAFLDFFSKHLRPTEVTIKRRQEAWRKKEATRTSRAGESSTVAATVENEQQKETSSLDVDLEQLVERFPYVSHCGPLEGNFVHMAFQSDFGSDGGDTAKAGGGRKVERDASKASTESSAHYHRLVPILFHQLHFPEGEQTAQTNAVRLTSTLIYGGSSKEAFDASTLRVNDEGYLFHPIRHFSTTTTTTATMSKPIMGRPPPTIINTCSSSHDDDDEGLEGNRSPPTVSNNEVAIREEVTTTHYYGMLSSQLCIELGLDYVVLEDDDDDDGGDDEKGTKAQEEARVEKDKEASTNEDHAQGQDDGRPLFRIEVGGKVHYIRSFPKGQKKKMRAETL